MMSHEHESLYEDDDGFYAELRRQILNLTADDEEFLEKRLSNCKPSTKLYESSCCTLQPGNYFSWWESMDGVNGNNSVPTWLVNLWRHGHGTGVFIPQIVTSRRKHKYGRMKFGRRQMQKQENTMK